MKAAKRHDGKRIICSYFFFFEIQHTNGVNGRDQELGDEVGKDDGAITHSAISDPTMPDGVTAKTMRGFNHVLELKDEGKKSGCHGNGCGEAGETLLDWLPVAKKWLAVHWQQCVG
jgi:hypothetical protein